VNSRGVRMVLLRVGERIKGGASFAEALADHPRYFDVIYRKMVEAGEASGELATALRELAAFRQRQLELTDNITAALTYPAFLGVVGLAVASVLIGFVVPKIVSVLAMQGRELPLATQALLVTGRVVSRYWWALVLGGFSVYFGTLQLLKLPRVRLRWDRLKLRVPVVGSLLHRQLLARWARTFSSLLRSGLPVTEALDILRDASGNTAFGAALAEMRDTVVGGGTLAAAAEKQGVFPAIVVQMITVGEESGTLDELLLQISEAFDQHAQVTTRRLTSLLEPALILVMGGFVALIILAVLLPILEIQQVF